MLIYPEACFTFFHDQERKLQYPIEAVAYFMIFFWIELLFCINLVHPSMEFAYCAAM